MTPQRLAAVMAVFVASLPLFPARAAVVVNEIFYHAPNDLDDVQWVELHNTDKQAVDLSNWSLAKGAAYTFPAGTKIPAGGYLVVARKPVLIHQFYQKDAMGPLEKPMSHGGARIELRDAAGKVVDVARYKDEAPWPVSADGYSASLERICPTTPGDAAENWAASPLPTNAPRPAGTPGKANAAYSANPLPVVAKVTLTPDDPAPDQPIRVEAEVKADQALREVTLAYRVVTKGLEGPEQTLPMTVGAAKNLYAAEIPAQKAGTIVRYRVKAASATSDAQRWFPAENDLRPTLSTYVHDKWETAKIPFGQIFNIRPPKGAGGGGGFRAFFGGNSGPAPAGSGPRPPRGPSAFVYVDTQTGKTTLFDYVNIVPRNGDRGYKVYFHKDRLLNGMSKISLLFEGSERFLLAEMLAYDVYRRAGNAASLADFMRLWVDGRMVGYHLLVENPNRAFLRRNKVNPDGDLYKIRWYGNGVVGQHDKQTNAQTGHADLLATLRKLQTTRGDAQWKVIQENFDVDQVATYFAVNMVLSHWDGYFNNHFVYHDLQGTKKWQMYPWDQDKTWGFHDGIGGNDVFIDMPLTFGMEGARPPGGGFGGGPFGGGGTPWWRDGGHFSKPLLANPQFRKIFLARVRDLLDNVYTEKVYGPILDQTADRLKDDVKLRANFSWGDANNATRQLDENIRTLRTHLVKRREWLLAQPELRDLDKTPAGKPAR